MSKLISHYALLLLFALGMTQCEEITSVEFGDFGELESFAATPPHIGLTLNLSQQELSSGQELDLQINLVNRSDSLIDVHLPYNLYNFIVIRSDSTIIWDRVRDNFNGIPIPDVLLEFYIEGGDTLSFQHTWDLKDPNGQSVASGSYMIFGTLDIITWNPEKFKHDNILFATDPAHITISK